MSLIRCKLKNEEIAKFLQDAYGLQVDKISFLPIGADLNSTVYRVETNSKVDCFLKLRHGNFNEASVNVPKYLADIGMKQVIPPISTKIGQLWTNLSSSKAILYPYIDGNNGIERPLSDQQWIEFGKTMKIFHCADIPRNIISGVQSETFHSKWRDPVKNFLSRVENESFEDPIAAEMALFLKSKDHEILKLVNRATDLAHLLQTQSLEYILCHADIHGWNVFIDKNGSLYIIDWDTLIFAPKERDLMFIGAGIGNNGCNSIEEASLFYQGYGSTNINQDAIAYYRLERIIEDIGEYCKQVFCSDEDADSKMQSFKYLKSNFLSNGTLERAYLSNHCLYPPSPGSYCANEGLKRENELRDP